MKHLSKYLAIGLLFSFSAGLYAQEIMGNTGNDLIVMWNVWKTYADGPSVSPDLVGTFHFAYYSGLVDGVMAGLQIGGLVEYPQGFILGQACRVVGKFLEEHPELLHQRNTLLVTAALMKAFLKKK